MFQNPVYMQIGSVLSIIYSAQLVANINMDIKSIRKPIPVTELFQIRGGRGGVAAEVGAVMLFEGTE